MKPSLSSRSLLLFFAFASTPFLASQAEVRLPGFFTDHMVLQQQMDIQVWGWAEPGETVTVTLGDRSASTTTTDSGNWRISLPAHDADRIPRTLTVKGTNTIELKDVLIGEVWLCSGQSNMEWTVASSSNAKAEIAAADFPLIRHMKVAHRPSTTPLEDITAEWQTCGPNTAGSFTACGYFMARHLHKELGIPIGLINSSWGGTRVEPWTPPVGFEKVDAVAEIYQSVLNRTPGTVKNRALVEKHLADTEAWVNATKRALASNDSVTPSPAYPADLTPFKSHQDPTMLYNGMIHALVGMPIRGAIWYQGESNHTEGMLYTEKKKALINGWRELWGQGEFPFYYVQIAPFKYGNENAAILAKFWEAQAAVQKIPNTGMVVINDIATLNNIHPPNKQDVGHRLALLALKNQYGRNVVANSPEMLSMTVGEGELRIQFKYAGGGLKTRDGQPPSHFEIIGAGSNGYQAAAARIDGDTITLTSDKVANPVAFRFAWDKLAEPNLTGGTGLPVGAFRGGTEPDFLSQLTINAEYRLVYELDLARLGRQITYDTDNSDQIQSFSRVGYLLELRSDNGGDQSVFVSMDAFTDDIKKIGIPTTASGASFQQNISNMNVFSNADDIVKGTSIDTGNIEFWPNNYAGGNTKRVPGASNDRFDFGDVPGPPRDGYGSMQVHNHGAKQTIFSVNHWVNGGTADIGIGNNSGANSDWTFSGNANSYSKKRLRIYVK